MVRRAMVLFYVIVLSTAYPCAAKPELCALNVRRMQGPYMRVFLTLTCYPYTCTTYTSSRLDYIPDVLHRSVMQVGELSQHCAKRNVWFETGIQVRSEILGRSRLACPQTTLLLQWGSRSLRTLSKSQPKSAKVDIFENRK